MAADKIPSAKRLTVSARAIYLKNVWAAERCFREKYWNMYSPDSKIRQEKYSDLQLPFNYAQVECNSVYRAMIHHMITGADVPTDTVVDIFGNSGWRRHCVQVDINIK